LKKKILLIVRRTSGEIDWILPLLHKVRDKYEIITVFENKKIYHDLKRNKQLFFLWSVISKKFYVRSIKDDLFQRSLIFIFNFLENTFKKSFQEKKKKVFMDIFFHKILKSKLKIKHLNCINFLFHDWGGFTGWINAFKNCETKIIYFPHSSLEYSIAPKHLKNLYGNLMIVGSKNVRTKWKNLFKGKIINTGHFKYSPDWLKKFNQTNYGDKKFKIVLPMKDWINDIEKNKLKNILLPVFEILDKYSKKIILYIKLSRKDYFNNKIFINLLLKQFKFKFRFCEDSLLSLAKESDLFLVFNDSSVTFDALSQKTISIELWNKNPKISTTKRYTFQVKNKNDFEKIFTNILFNKTKNLLKKKYQIFDKNFLSEIKYNNILKYL
jgi:hypothetical protein